MSISNDHQEVCETGYGLRKLEKLYEAMNDVSHQRMGGLEDGCSLEEMKTYCLLDI